MGPFFLFLHSRGLLLPIVPVCIWASSSFSRVCSLARMTQFFSHSDRKTTQMQGAAVSARSSSQQRGTHAWRAAVACKTWLRSRGHRRGMAAERGQACALARSSWWRGTHRASSDQRQEQEQQGARNRLAVSEQLPPTRCGCGPT